MVVVVVVVVVVVIVVIVVVVVVVVVFVLSKYSRRSALFSQAWRSSYPSSAHSSCITKTQDHCLAPTV